jgi:FtsZ-binding cell division protein ZapB
MEQMSQMYQIALNNLKNWNRKLETEMNFYKQNYTSQKDSFEHLTTENAKMKVQVFNYRERMLMQREDFLV